jgi:hypothetical protein
MEIKRPAYAQAGVMCGAEIETRHMKTFKVLAAFGDQTKVLKIATATGGSDGYQILIDNYYHGMILFYEGKWVGRLNEKSELTVIDVEIIGRIIEDKFGESE